MNEKQKWKIELWILTHANVASNAANREKDTCPPPCSDGGLRSHCKSFFSSSLFSCSVGGLHSKSKKHLFGCVIFMSLVFLLSLKMGRPAAIANHFNIYTAHSFPLLFLCSDGRLRRQSKLWNVEILTHIYIYLWAPKHFKTVETNLKSCATDASELYKVSALWCRAPQLE